MFCNYCVYLFSSKIFRPQRFKIHPEQFLAFISLTFRCTCADGFEGESCDINIDDCEDNDCENNSTCVDGINNYTCLCPPEYTGMQKKKCVINRCIRLKASPYYYVNSPSHSFLIIGRFDCNNRNTERLVQPSK